VYLFKQGLSYAAGFDKPAILSADTIAEGVTDRGFSVLLADECAEQGLPFATPSSCGDSWDWIAIVERTAPDELIEVPDRVKWIVPLTGGDEAGEIGQPLADVPTVDVFACAEAAARMCDAELRRTRLRWGLGAAAATAAAAGLVVYATKRR